MTKLTVEQNCVCLCDSDREREEKMLSRSAQWAASSPSDGCNSPSSVPLLPLQQPYKQSLFILPHPLPFHSFSPFCSVYSVSSWGARFRIWSKWPKLEWELRTQVLILSNLTRCTCQGVTSGNWWKHRNLIKQHVTEVCIISKRSSMQKERTVEFPTAVSPNDIIIACANISVLIHFFFETSQKTFLQHKLSACEMITQGTFQCQVWTHRTSFSWACGRSVCVLHNSVVSGPCSLGQDLDREYYCGHHWWTIPHLTVFLIYKPAKSNA